VPSSKSGACSCARTTISSRKRDGNNGSTRERDSDNGTPRSRKRDGGNDVAGSGERDGRRDRHTHRTRDFPGYAIPSSHPSE
jgi:hypothetical protein